MTAEGGGSLAELKNSEAIRKLLTMPQLQTQVPPAPSKHPRSRFPTLAIVTSDAPTRLACRPSSCRPAVCADYGAAAGSALMPTQVQSAAPSGPARGGGPPGAASAAGAASARPHSDASRASTGGGDRTLDLTRAQCPPILRPAAQRLAVRPRLAQGRGPPCRAHPRPCDPTRGQRPEADAAGEPICGPGGGLRPPVPINGDRARR